MSLNPKDYERAIDSIVARRDALIMQWADNPNAYQGIPNAGFLEKIESDLRCLRRLQADAGIELTNQASEGQTAPGEVHRIRSATTMPDWLLDHQND